MFYEIIPTKVFRKGMEVLTYSADDRLAVGQIVEVPLGKGKCLGVVSKRVAKPEFEVRPIIQKYGVLPKWLWRAGIWLAKYYLVDLPTVFKMILPSNMKVGRKTVNGGVALAEIKQKNSREEKNAIKLNRYQQKAIKQIKETKKATKLLRGVTGSGKTNVYLSLIGEQIEMGKSAILLVPEISLTSQLVMEAKKYYGGRVVVLHSRQTEATRREIWKRIMAEEEAMLVVGPRSALLAPVRNLGLIIIDEAHEATYYQEQTPKYSALRLASFIAKDQGITTLLGTATPLVSDYYLARRNDAVVELSQKAKTTAVKPDIEIVSFKQRENFQKNRYFADTLIKRIVQNLEDGNQSLIFHNRRGSAPLTVCEKCGWQALCVNCFLPMTLHMDGYELRCHTCGRVEPVPKMCPECKGVEIIHKGFGTKLLESEIQKIFPKARVARFDADNRTGETLDAMYDEIKNGEIDIIIGTQTVAKGLDLPRLATVGVVQADAGMALPDYAAEEKTFHLLTQVLGRVGRGHIEKASAVIQTYQPDSPMIEAAIAEDYEKFYRYLLEKRRKGKLPPFRYLAKVALTYKTEKIVLKNIQILRRQLVKNADIEVSVAMPAFHEHTVSGYTWQIILKAGTRDKIIGALAGLKPDKHLHVSIDPPSLL